MVAQPRSDDEEAMSPSQWLADSEVAMTNTTPQAGSAWEYLIVSLPSFGPAQTMQGQSASVSMLNHEGQQGWEAVGMTGARRGRGRRAVEACGTAQPNHRGGVTPGRQERGVG
jgi:hypothetical protein